MNPRFEPESRHTDSDRFDAVPGAGGWRRLSGRMLLIHPVREVGRFIPALAGVFFVGNKGGQGHWWSLGFLVLVLGISVVRWATTRFRITPEQIQLRTGLLRQRIIAAPADRVRTVDITEHALHRLLGLARVAIGTGTSDRKREALVLDGLGREEARSLRIELLHRGQAGGSAAPGPAAAIDSAPGQAGGHDPTWAAPGGRRVPAGALEPPGRAAPVSADEVDLLRFDPAWVRFAPFTLSGAVTALAVLGFSWNILQQSQVNAGNLGAIQSASRHLRHAPLWLSVIEVGIGMLVAVSILSSVGYALAFWNFRLTRHSGGTLQVTRGLITSRTTSIEHRRLRGVEVSETLLLRLAGGARLLAVATGLRIGRGAERGGTVLAPPAPADLILRIAGQVLDDPRAISAVRLPLTSHGPLALRRRLIRASGPWALAATGLTVLWLRAEWPAWTAVIALIGVAASPWLAVDRYRSLGHGVAEGYLISRWGSLIRRRVALHGDAIIGWNERQSIFQRRLGLVTLDATTAAGRQRYRVADITAAEAIAIAELITPGLLEQFLLPLPEAGRQ